MTTIEHDLSLDHGKGNYWNLACLSCRLAYDADHRALLARWNELDEAMAARTADEEPWTVQPEPVTREWSRWAVVLCVASMVFIALYLGRNGS